MIVDKLLKLSYGSSNLIRIGCFEPLPEFTDFFRINLSLDARTKISISLFGEDSISATPSLLVERSKVFFPLGLD